MDYIKKIVAIFIGSNLLAIGINFLLVPFRILDGGIIGLALIINYLTGIKIGFSIVIFSLPIYIFAWLHYRNFFYNSIVGMLVSSFIIDLLYPYQYHFTYFVRLTPFASSIIGGTLVGIGIGCMLRNDTSIGGADMLAQILSNYLHLNVGVIIFIIDAIVIVLGGFLLSFNTFFLSAIAITAVGIATSVCTFNHKLSDGN